MKQTVCVIGAGAWGTAVSTVLAHNGHTVKLWCHENSVIEDIKKYSVNKKYMPDIELSKLIIPTNSLEEALVGVEWVFEAVPVKYMRSVLEAAQSFVRSDQKWVALSKGIEDKTLLLPTQIIDNVFDAAVQTAVCVGPSFAHGVVRKEFTAVTVASSEKAQTSALKQILQNEYFKPYESSDMIGVQVGAALKNVIALGIGILEGAQTGENAKAFVLTKGLHDMVICAQALGGQKDTIYGLSGVGDLVLTCTGGFSRNVMVGTLFGQGKDLDAVIAEKGVVPEGVNTVKLINLLAEKYDTKLPVCQGIYNMVFAVVSVADFLARLSE